MHISSTIEQRLPLSRRYGVQLTVLELVVTYFVKPHDTSLFHFFMYLSQTHFRTIFSLTQGATGGAGAVLVTLTAQTPESRYGNMKSLFDEIVDSYRKL